MTDYTKATNFAVKDGLPSGNPAKLIKGTEIDTEFTAIQTAVASKADEASPSLSGTVTLASGTTISTNGVTVSDVELGYVDGVTSNIQTQLNAKQANDAELTAIAGLTSAADQAPYFTGSGTAALMTVTAAARTVLDDTTTGAMLTTLGAVAKAGDSLTGAINEAYATVASHATTAPIWTASGNVIDYTGTAVATDFPSAPQAGARRILICASACGFNNTATISTPGAANIVVTAGDVVEVIAITTTTFKIRTFASVLKGTFTPTLSSSGGGTPTYTHQIGNYTISGGRCNYSLRITLATLGTLAAGNLSIDGLPITSNSTTAFSQAQTIFITSAAVGLSSPIMATIVASSTSVLPYKFASGAVTQLTVADIAATTVIQLQGSYAI